jgi:hypothetical protein
MQAGAAQGPSFPASMVQFAATASRSPSGRRCAIGYAEPRPGDHSQGMGAYEEDGGEIGSSVSSGQYTIMRVMR